MPDHLPRCRIQRSRTVACWSSPPDGSASSHLSQNSTRRRTRGRAIRGSPDSFVSRNTSLAMARRCFISAPADVAVAPLIAALKARGWEPFVLSDVATLGVSLTEAVQDAIRRADVVIALFGEDTSSSPNTAFEVGFAVALQKPVLLLVSPGADVPSDLRSFLYVQADPGNLEAVVLALDNLDRYTGQLYPEKSPLSTAAPLGQYADYLLDEARTLRDAPEAKFEDLVRRAIEASGALAVASPAPDRGFDIGVWSDDLDAIGGNPLLIELKHHVNEQSVRQSLTALHRTPNARVALLVSLDERPPGLASLRWPVLWISLASLLQRMRSETFAEVIRDLRNRSVHGLAG